MRLMYIAIFRLRLLDSCLLFLPKRVVGNLICFRIRTMHFFAVEGPRLRAVFPPPDMLFRSNETRQLHY